MGDLIRWSARAGVGLGLAALGACGHAKGGTAQDASLTSRVVCVSKQINEFVYEIGAESHLVARDLTLIYPPAITSLPSVGYHRALSAEGIIPMRPTLFLTDGNVGPDAVLAQLRKVGVPILVLEPGSTLDSAEGLMRDLGRRFARTQAADSLVAAWQTGMDSVFADTARWETGHKPRVLVMHFGQIYNNYLGLKNSGPSADMIRWAGGQNAIDSTGGMERLTPSSSRAWHPMSSLRPTSGSIASAAEAKFAAFPASRSRQLPSRDAFIACSRPRSCTSVHVRRRRSASSRRYFHP